MQRSIRVPSLLVLVLIVAPSSAVAAPLDTPGRFGLGLEASRGGAIAWKYILTSTSGFQGAVGSPGYREYGGIDVHVDYVKTLGTLGVAASSVRFPWYVGIGGEVWTYDGDSRFFYNDKHRYEADGMALAARGVLGLAVQFQAVPIDVYLQLTPTVLVVPGIDFYVFHGALGFRYYF